MLKNSRVFILIFLLIVNINISKANNRQSNKNYFYWNIYNSNLSIGDRTRIEFVSVGAEYYINGMLEDGFGLGITFGTGNKTYSRKKDKYTIEPSPYPPSYCDISPYYCRDKKVFAGVTEEYYSIRDTISQLEFLLNLEIGDELFIVPFYAVGYLVSDGKTIVKESRKLKGGGIYLRAAGMGANGKSGGASLFIKSLVSKDEDELPIFIVGYKFSLSF